VIERCITAGIFLLFSLNKQLAIIIALLIVQIALIIILRPYAMTGSQVRPILNLSISLVIEVIYMLTPYLSMPLYNLYAPFVILGLLAISICYNVYYLIKTVCGNENQSN
jgi:hypothetical protein